MIYKKAMSLCQSISQKLVPMDMGSRAREPRGGSEQELGPGTSRKGKLPKR